MAEFQDTAHMDIRVIARHTALGVEDGEPVDPFAQILVGDDEYRYAIQGLDNVTTGCSVEDSEKLARMLRQAIHHALIGFGFQKTPRIR